MGGVSEDSGDEPEPALAGGGADDGRVQGLLGWWKSRYGRGYDESLGGRIQLSRCEVEEFDERVHPSKSGEAIGNLVASYDDDV